MARTQSGFASSAAQCTLTSSFDGPTCYFLNPLLSISLFLEARSGNTFGFVKTDSEECTVFVLMGNYYSKLNNKLVCLGIKTSCLTIINDSRWLILISCILLLKLGIIDNLSIPVGPFRVNPLALNFELLRLWLILWLSFITKI